MRKTKADIIIPAGTELAPTREGWHEAGVKEGNVVVAISDYNLEELTEGSDAFPAMVEFGIEFTKRHWTYKELSTKYGIASYERDMMRKQYRELEAINGNLSAQLAELTVVPRPVASGALPWIALAVASCALVAAL